MIFKYILDPKSWKLLGIKRGIFKWQIISSHSQIQDGGIQIKHYRLLKLLGARLHNKPEIDALEFRLSYFRILSTGTLQLHEYLAIPIPFLKFDIDLCFRNIEKKVYL